MPRGERWCSAVHVSLYGPEGLLAYDVLYPAGVLRGQLLWHAQRGQPAGKEQMPLIDALGNGPALLGKGDKAVPVHGYAAPLS